MELPTIDRDLVADVNVDPNDIRSELLRQASLFAYWNEAVHQDEIRLRQLKLELEVYEAELYEELRRRQKGVEGKRVTEAQLERQMRLNNGWIAKKQKVNEAEVEVSRKRGVLTSLIHKKDTIVVLGNNERAEIRAILSGKGS